MRFYSISYTAHDICANSAHDPVCEQLMDAHDIYANSAFDMCKRSMQIALTHEGQAALWVTSDCIFMSNPITTLFTLKGVDNDMYRNIELYGNHIQ